MVVQNDVDGVCRFDCLGKIMQEKVNIIIQKYAFSASCQTPVNLDPPLLCGHENDRGMWACLVFLFFFKADELTILENRLL